MFSDTLRCRQVESDLIPHLLQDLVLGQSAVRSTALHVYFKARFILHKK